MYIKKQNKTISSILYCIKEGFMKLLKHPLMLLSKISTKHKAKNRDQLLLTTTAIYYYLSHKK